MVTVVALLLHVYSASTVAALLCTLVAVATAATVLLPPKARLCSAPLPIGGLAIEDFTSTPFVILACQRTGSSSLLSYLQPNSACQMHTELFNYSSGLPNQERRVYDMRGFLDKKWLNTTARDADPSNFLQAAFCAHTPLHRACGYKLFPEHIRR
ncbi:hypothetical protein T492DRAFT_839810 [Pavlovales sp. CCMP2436]|nr:hypothetical protein T492DRAFT_839810 [Pavlovales sp. CCMP2436]